jgi:hypothetical protein
MAARLAFPGKKMAAAVLQYVTQDFRSGVICLCSDGGTYGRALLSVPALAASLVV